MPTLGKQYALVFNIINNPCHYVYISKIIPQNMSPNSWDCKEHGFAFWEPLDD